MRSPIRLAAAAVVLAGTFVLAGPSTANAADTGAIDGLLTTSGGEPVADYTVSVYRDDEQFTFVDSTSTDASGGYRFGALPAGDYLLEFDLYGERRQYHHRKHRIWQADPVTVVNGQTTGVQEQLFPTGVLTGVIRDRAGNPLPDLYVRAGEVDTYDGFGQQTDPDGRFRFEVPVGRYTVEFYPLADSYQTQYIPGAISPADAQVFEVRDGETTVADDTVLGTGSFTGRFTQANGQPLREALIQIDPRGGAGIADLTDSDGTLTVPRLLAGTYEVTIHGGENVQYYKGKRDPDEADPVVIRAGEETEISDSLLPTGSVRVRAKDAVTGANLLYFCVRDECSTGNGQVLLKDLPTGDNDLYAYTNERAHFPLDFSVSVTADAVVDVAIELRPAAQITTTIVDRQTGEPVQGVCLDALRPREARLVDSRGYCSTNSGRIIVGPLEAGTYRLFAVPPSDGPYGRQWVGTSGGSGDERKAATVETTIGTMATAPQVKLDRAGAIRGRVSDSATGAGLADATVSLLTSSPGVGVSDATTDADGDYRLDGLGPYEWPVVFGKNGYASHWSGVRANRYEAQTIKVTAGGTATHDTALTRGATMTGSVRDEQAATATAGFVMAHNSVTGDIMAVALVDEDGGYEMPTLGPQSVYLTYEVRLAGRWRHGRYEPRLPPRTGDAPGTPRAGDVPSRPAGSSTGEPSTVPSPADPSVPAGAPGAGPAPGVGPSTSPGVGPSTSPGVGPSTSPGVGPSTSAGPGTMPGAAGGPANQRRAPQPKTTDAARPRKPVNPLGTWPIPVTGTVTVHIVLD